MAWETAVVGVHAVSATFCLLLGPILIFRRRRDRAHRVLGRTHVVAMLVICGTSFLIHPHGFGWLHGLSVFTAIGMVLAVTAIRRGQVGLHRFHLVGSYLGLLVAFGFAVAVPHRLVPTLLREQPMIVLATALGVGALAGVHIVVVLRSAAARPAGSAPMVSDGLPSQVERA